MESFEVRLAFLENGAAQDSKSEARLTKDSEGNRRAVTVERKTNGVEHSGKASARHSARVWHSFGRPIPEFKQIEYRASWDDHDYEGRGRMLIVNMSNGFTQESYRPMDADDAAADPSEQE